LSVLLVSIQRINDYCNTQTFVQQFSIQKIPIQKSLFIDNEKKMLLQYFREDGNKYGSIPIGHSVTLQEKYDNIKVVLEKIQYDEHQWVICVDLKMVCFLLGQQSGYTNYLIFYAYGIVEPKLNIGLEKIGQGGTVSMLGRKNIVNEPLVDPNRIIFPPLHIKLGLMKQFV